MDVGATLQGARERSGLSLEELARRTRISVRVLRAMESNAFDAIPGGIFTRGFLRAYSLEVGLDPDATIEQFLARPEAVDTPAEPPPRSRADGAPAEDTLVVQGYRAYESPSDRGSEAGKAIAIALVSLGFVAYLSLGTPRDPVTEALPGPDAEGAARPDTPAVLLASDPAQPVATAGEVFDVTIRPTGPCWVEAVVDGNRRIYTLMQAGERETLTVHETLVLRVGNPAAFAFSLNGRPGRLPGHPGQPITIRVDADTFTDFLATTSG